MSDAMTTLISSWGEREREDLGDGMFAVKLTAGEPHTWAIYNAVLDRYNAITGRPRPREDDLANLLGQKVTLVKNGENMLGGGMIVAHEGTLTIGSSGSPIIIPKRARNRGFKIDYDRLLDVIPGYSTAKAQALVDEVRSHFPTLRPLTQERLNKLPERSETLTLCVFGSYRMPDSTCSDAIVLASEYDAENDIVDGGVVLLRPEHGVSEHGSVYGQNLLRGHFGEVVGYEPITFRDALHLCDLDFDEAFALLMRQEVTV